MSWISLRLVAPLLFALDAGASESGTQEACENIATLIQEVTEIYRLAPEILGVPPDATVECDAVPPPPQPTVRDTGNLQPGLGFREWETAGSCPGEYRLVREWSASDHRGNRSSWSQTLEVVDTTPPVVESGSDDLHCLWLTPPNHKYVCFDLQDFAPRGSDACSEPLEWRFTGCASDQPDDANESDPGSAWGGDGNTTGDCVVVGAGERICVRSERCSTGPTARRGRRYTVSMAAADACGNTSTPAVIGRIHVPDDQGRGGTSCH